MVVFFILHDEYTRQLHRNKLIKTRTVNGSRFHGVSRARHPVSEALSSTHPVHAGISAGRDRIRLPSPTKLSFCFLPPNPFSIVHSSRPSSHRLSSFVATALFTAGARGRQAPPANPLPFLSLVRQARLDSPRQSPMPSSPPANGRSTNRTAD